MQDQMVYFMPIITVVICFTLPAALALYWSFSTAINILQAKLTYQKIEEEESKSKKKN